MAKKHQEKTLDVFEEAIRDKTKAYDIARAKIESDIKSIEQNPNPYDPNSEAEDRNEIRFLEGQLSKLDQEHKQKILELTIEKKEK